MICPFAIEIYTVIKWMAKGTHVSLADFFVTTDTKLRLKILICNKVKENSDEKQKMLAEKTIGFNFMNILFLHFDRHCYRNRQPTVLLNVDFTVG
jgi:hypothetical protein